MADLRPSALMLVPLLLESIYSGIASHKCRLAMTKVAEFRVLAFAWPGMTAEKYVVSLIFFIPFISVNSSPYSFSALDLAFSPSRLVAQPALSK